MNDRERRGGGYEGLRDGGYEGWMDGEMRLREEEVEVEEAEREVEIDREGGTEKGRWR
jgi:hypothetical protein